MECRDYSTNSTGQSTSPHFSHSFRCGGLNVTPALPKAAATLWMVCLPRFGGGFRHG